MSKILIVDSDKIERMVTNKILSEGLDGVEAIYEAENCDEGVAVLQDCKVDVLILNVAQSTIAMLHLINFARGKNPQLVIILTTVKNEEEIFHALMKLRASDYLLKPFRPEAILRLVEKYVLPIKNNLKIEEKTLNTQRYIEMIGDSIKQCSYKKCIETTKEYIDFVYENCDNINKISEKIVELAETVARLTKSYGPDLQAKLSMHLEKLRFKYDRNGKKYNIYNVLSQMVDDVFDEIEKEYLYSDDDVKKVLNYIDRNIKKGITLDDAAEYINMSSCYFSKFFKKAMKVNFITYVTDRKIEYAKEMLINTDMPIINIAYDLSYNETNYFSKAFKKKVGITPTEYREKYAGIKIPDAV